MSCIEVRKTDEDEDRSGVDYWAVLRGGRKIAIDAKARTKGTSCYWNGEPELALEKWSVRPDRKHKEKVGWTLDESKATELVLFTFDPSDCSDVFLMSFQLLRMAFRRKIKRWYELYKTDVQDSGNWRSECIFVPVSIVQSAILNVSHAQQRGVSVEG